MRTSRLGLLALGLTAACGDPRALLVEGSVLPSDDGACTFAADGPLAQSPPVMDVASGFTFRLPVVRGDGPDPRTSRNMPASPC